MFLIFFQISGKRIFQQYFVLFQIFELYNLFISYAIHSVAYSLFGGVISNIDNNNGPASYEKRTHDARGSQLTKQNYSRKLSDIADKYRYLLNEPLMKNSR